MFTTNCKTLLLLIQQRRFQKIELRFATTKVSFEVEPEFEHLFYAINVTKKEAKRVVKEHSEIHQTWDVSDCEDTLTIYLP